MFIWEFFFVFSIIRKLNFVFCFCNVMVNFMFRIGSFVLGNLVLNRDCLVFSKDGWDCMGKRLGIWVMLLGEGVIFLKEVFCLGGGLLFYWEKLFILFLFIVFFRRRGGGDVGKLGFCFYDFWLFLYFICLFIIFW